MEDNTKICARPGCAIHFTALDRRVKYCDDPTCKKKFKYAAQKKWGKKTTEKRQADRIINPLIKICALPGCNNHFTAFPKNIKYCKDNVCELKRGAIKTRKSFIKNEESIRANMELNRDENNAKSRVYYGNNLEKCRGTSSRYKIRNPDKIQTYKDKDSTLLRNTERYHENKRAATFFNDLGMMLALLKPRPSH
jgi:hypothetical protein